MNARARQDDDEPVVEVVEVIETHRSHSRVRSAGRRAIDLDDAHERPTVVPAEPVDVEALEARVLYESRAVMERRYAVATQQDLQATRKMDAIDLEAHFAALPRATERRSTRVRVFALSLMLAIVVAIAAAVFLR